MVKSRFHTNDEGRTLPCDAAPGNCKFIHGSTPEEAASNWQLTMASQLMPKAVSRSAEYKRRIELSERPLKSMDDGELEEAILLESRALELDTQRIQEAVNLARELHAHQRRKGNRGSLENPPYIEHPLRNTLRLIRMGVKDQETVEGSILHDTVEDGSGVFARKYHGYSRRQSTDEEQTRKLLLAHLKLRFQGRTAEIVLAVSNPIEKNRDLAPEEKRANYKRHVEEQISRDSAVFLVKTSDFIDNATGLYHGQGSMDPQKLANQAQKYLDTLGSFEDAYNKLHLPIPERSKVLIGNAFAITRKRLARIIEGKPAR